MRKKQIGALLVSGVLVGTSIGFSNVSAKDINEEFTNPGVCAEGEECEDSYVGVMSSTQVYPESPVSPEKIISTAVSVPLTLEVKNENGDEIEWTPEVDDIRPVDSQVYICAMQLEAYFYINASELDKLLVQTVGDNFEIVMDDFSQEELDLFKSWGWEGSVLKRPVMCRGNASYVENWQPAFREKFIAAEKTGIIRHPEVHPASQEVEELLAEKVPFSLLYLNTSDEENRTIELDYIPETLHDLNCIEENAAGLFKFEGTLNLESYFDQIASDEGLSVTRNLKTNDEDFQPYEQPVIIEGTLNDEGELFYQVLPVEIVEDDELPDFPLTIGDYTLVDQISGDTLANGKLIPDVAKFEYKVGTKCYVEDNTLTGFAAIDTEKAYAFIQEQTGIEVKQDLPLGDYGFSYYPLVRHLDLTAWEPYYYGGDETIYFYTRPDVEREPEPEPEPTPANLMYRFYNPNSGEHFYTYNVDEGIHLVSLGWVREGVGWFAPSKSDYPVYRLYNPNAGDHHFTMNKAERDHLISLGWNDEGIGWYSDAEKAKPVYRQYNPNAKAGAHNYTTNAAERDYLVSLGWKDEGIGWYALNY